MITTETPARLVRSMETRCDIPIRVALSYDEYDPMAIAMTFISDEGDNIWVASRESLAEALDTECPVGRGDVRFRCDRGARTLQVCLRAMGGHADILLPLMAVGAWMDEVDAAADEADHFLAEAVDAAIEELLS